MEDLFKLVNECKKVYFAECGYLPDTIIFDEEDFDKIRPIFLKFCCDYWYAYKYGLDHILQLHICTDELLSTKGHVTVLRTDGHLKYNCVPDRFNDKIGYFISDPVLCVKLNSKYTSQNSDKEGDPVE